MDIKTEKKLFTIPLKLPFTLNDFIRKPLASLLRISGITGSEILDKRLLFSGVQNKTP